MPLMQINARHGRRRSIALPINPRAKVHAGRFRAGGKQHFPASVWRMP
jgi:hypothetical protein